MKNFPHQFNDLSKLTKALIVFSQLIADGKDVSDDAIVGTALARAGIYQFRDKTLSIENALIKERQKPPSNQGTRTAARELRRFFRLLGFSTDSLDISKFGNTLLEAEDSETGNLIWRMAMLDLALPDNVGRVSHPYRILLKMVEERPGIQKSFLALAFEPVDDSDEELKRMLKYVDADNLSQTIRDIDATDSLMKNAIKILPPIAIQLGDIREDGQLCYRELPELLPVTRELNRRPKQKITSFRPSRVVDSSQIAPIPTPNENAKQIDPEQQMASMMEGAEALRERTDRHQIIVKKFAALCENAGFTLREDPFDCLAISPTNPSSILAEIKTLSGDPSDERHQLQRALAQLIYYSAFNLPSSIEMSKVIKVAIFESKIADAHIALLSELSIGVLWVQGNEFNGSRNTLDLLHELRITH